MKTISYIILFCSLWTMPVLAQGDIVLTDSTSTDWGGGSGGGITPSIPNEPVTSMTISTTTLTLGGGETERINVIFNTLARNKQVTWSVSDPSIAFVNTNGVVLGMGVGTTKVTVTSVDNNSFTATCTVTVTSDYVQKEAGWLLKKGTEEPWQMKYIFYPVRDEYVEPAGDNNGYTWHDFGYDDSQWQTLIGPMSSDGDGNFLWQGDDNSFCLRREVIIPKLGAGKLRFYINNDDGILFWLNGHLVVDFNDWSNGEYREYEISAADCVQGINQLSVYITQGGGGARLDYGLWYEPTMLLGDVNSDGTVDIADAVCIVNHIVGKPTSVFVDAAADVNHDDAIDIADAVCIVNLIVGKIDAFARRWEFAEQEPD